MNMLNTPTYIYEELKRRKVKVEIISEEDMLMRYYHDGRWRFIKGCFDETASVLAMKFCNDKRLTEYIAKQVKLKLPASERFESEAQAMRFIERHGPVVIKPVDTAHGNGISMNVKSRTGLKKALALAKKFSNKPPLLQQFVQGSDVRMLIIDGKFAAAVRRVPATVVGDGEHTIAELIDIENNRPVRSKSISGKLKIISLHAARAYLSRKIRKVPKKGEKVEVVGVSNTSMGGHAEDYTDQVPKAAIKHAEAFAQKLRMPLCGVDIILGEDDDYSFIEANSSPGFGPHHHPRVGKERDVTAKFVDMLLKTDRIDFNK